MNKYQSEISQLPKAIQNMLYQEQVLHAKNLAYPWPEDSSVFCGELDEQYSPENQPVFKLPYYLIPESKADYCAASSITKKTSAHISAYIDGQKFYKLFVHPAAQDYYARLEQDGCSLIDAEKSEYLATPTSSYRSLFVWNPRAIEEGVFIAKLSISKVIFAEVRINDRPQIYNSIAVQHLFDAIGAEQLAANGITYFPEVAGLLPKHDDLGGQIIREIPAQAWQGTNQWIPFQALVSDQEFLLAKIIKASQLSAEEFVRTYLITAFLNTIKILNFQYGIVPFMPHLQNLSLEVDNDFMPTGRFVFRDFSGTNFDISVLMRSGIDLHNHANIPASSLNYQDSGAYVPQIFYVYRELLLRPLMAQLIKYENNFNETIANLLLEELKSTYIVIVKQQTGAILLDNEIETTEPFPAIRHKLLESGQALAWTASQSLEVGEMITLTAMMKQRLQENIRNKLWHDFGNRLPEELHTDLDLEVFFDYYQFYQAGQVIFARNKDNAIIGFTLII